MSSITIRQASLSDIEVLAPLFDEYRRFYECSSDIPAAHAFLQNRLKYRESALFIADRDNSPLGFTQLYPSFSSVSLARVFVLNDLFVREDARRQGIGSALISAATTYAKSMDATRLSLATETSNLEAQALYRSAGWLRNNRFFVYNVSL